MPGSRSSIAWMQFSQGSSDCLASLRLLGYRHFNPKCLMHIWHSLNTARYSTPKGITILAPATGRYIGFIKTRRGYLKLGRVPLSIHT